MTTVLSLAALPVGVLVSAATLHAEAVPQAGLIDSRIRTVVYNDDEVYRLRGFVGYHIELIFEPGETFAGTGGGDLEALTFGTHENHLILKPKATNVGTNLVIYTDRRAYRLDYAVLSGRPDLKRDDVVYAVRFIYPSTVRAGEMSPAQKVQAELSAAAKARPRNFDYWYCGHRAVRPIAASDDGVHTRLTFAATSELPAVFLQNDDGTESLVNFTVDNGDVVVHRIAAKFVVRRGKLIGCIVNKAFVGTAGRLETGTLSPEVVRDLKEASP